MMIEKFSLSQINFPYFFPFSQSQLSRSREFNTSTMRSLQQIPSTSITRMINVTRTLDTSKQLIPDITTKRFQQIHNMSQQNTATTSRINSKL
jgi:hypothetical protein